MEKIGIFGGTFNPPHVGHLNIARTFAAEYGLDRVLIIPTYVPPHKASPGLAPAAARVEMCRRTFTDPVFEVSAIEIDRKGKSYTYDTLRQLKGMYRCAKFYFLCGDDMLMSLHRWYRPEGILKYCTVVASVRSDKLDLSDLEAYAKEFFPAKYRCGRIRFMPIKPLELSSTEIRTKIKNGESIEGLVTKDTFDFITSEGLYL
ncbi:MAG: nicotinate-nucleotide adenylyltransferase [Clostridia bacterium]|nr:nicotinate-nucleotide adenylyltransferase [Clostridia bacterium]